MPCVAFVRKGPNPCFCWQARYFGGFAHFATSTRIERKSSRDRCPSDFGENSSIFSFPVATWRRRRSPGAVSECLWESLSILRGLPGPSQGARQASLGHSMDAPASLRDALGAQLERLGRPKSVPGSILEQFWASRIQSQTQIQIQKQIQMQLPIEVQIQIQMQLQIQIQRQVLTLTRSRARSKS